MAANLRLAGPLLLLAASLALACGDDIGGASSPTPCGTNSCDNLPDADPIGGPRDGEVWCVRAVGVDNSYEERAAQHIGSLLSELDAVRASHGLSGGLFPDSVEEGCPIEPAYDPIRCTTHDDPDLCPRRVKNPGKFSLMVHVLPKETIESLFKPEYTRVLPEEYECEGDVCSASTSGLYLAPSELGDPSFVRYWLYDAVGLRCHRPPDALPTGLPTPDYC